jgi:hypothetical protein
MTEVAGPVTPDVLAAIPARALLEHGLEARIPLPPGDRALVEVGAQVAPGDPIVEHLRDRRVGEVDVKAPAGAAATPVTGPGARWTPPPSRRRNDAPADGELLAPLPGRGDRWRIATGEHRVHVTSPLRGEVSGVFPGGELRIRAAGPAIRGALAAGASANGPLELATDPFGELRPGGIDVGRAGSILVVGSRIDAEALTRARAMGVRGIVVAALPGKELRDFQASERRQRASLHPTPPFAVLALEGAVRRPIPAAIAAILERLAGTHVALLVDPPALVFDEAPEDLPLPSPDRVRVRGGAHAGLEGRVVGLAGLRRYAANVQLDAAWVEFEGEPPVDVPIGDLERFLGPMARGASPRTSEGS